LIPAAAKENNVVCNTHNLHIKPKKLTIKTRERLAEGKHQTVKLKWRMYDGLKNEENGKKVGRKVLHSRGAIH